MTFDQIRSEVLERMSLSSSDASTRVGAAINRHYKRITSLLGMETTRYVSKDVLMTPGVRTVTVPGVEKVDRVADITSQLRPLSEVSLHTMRTLEPTAVEPQVWALSNTQAQAIVLMFDTFPTFAWTLRIDGWTTLTDLTGAGEPAFPASFHDILTWFVLAEELLRKEKSQLAAAYEQKAAGLLDDLRFHLADTHTRTLVQNSQPGGAPGGSGQGGGGGAPGGAQYLTNIPPGTVVGRASDQGTGNSQPITTGPHLLMTGSVLDAVGYIDKSGTPAVNQVATFADADTVQGYAGLAFEPAVTGLVLKGTAPYLDLNDQSRPVDGRLFRVANTAAELQLHALADAETGIAVPLRLTRAGDATIGRDLTVDRVLVLLNGQISFPLTQNPSAASTVLDDYREGSWTPIIGGTGGQSGQIYDIQSGTYIKWGRMVMASCLVRYTTKGTISGDAVIGGLPYPASSPTQAYFTCNVHYRFATTVPIASLIGVVTEGLSTILLHKTPGGGSSNQDPLPATELASPQILLATTLVYSTTN